MYCHFDFETEYKIPFKNLNKGKRTSPCATFYKRLKIHSYITTALLLLLHKPSIWSLLCLSPLLLSLLLLPLRNFSIWVRFCQQLHNMCIAAAFSQKIRAFSSSRGREDTWSRRRANASWVQFFFLFLLFSLLLFRKLLLRCWRSFASSSIKRGSLYSHGEIWRSRNNRQQMPVFWRVWFFYEECYFCDHFLP